MATAGHEILAVDRPGHKGTTDPRIRWASLDLAEAEPATEPAGAAATTAATDDIGFRFAAGDAAGCRAAVHRAASASPEVLAALGAAAAQRVRDHYGPAGETDGYLQVFAQT
jgi:hypothetical protein